jgi:hypothetical protein
MFLAAVFLAVLLALVFLALVFLGCNPEAQRGICFLAMRFLEVSARNKRVIRNPVGAEQVSPVRKHWEKIRNKHGAPSGAAQ